MVEFMNWFLLFVKDFVAMLFSLVSVDGYSLGNMLVAVAIVGVVVSSTIGAVALAARTLSTHTPAAPSGPSGSSGTKGDANNDVKAGY